MDDKQHWVLFRNGGKLLHADKRPGLTQASLIATPSHVFVVPHWSVEVLPDWIAVYPQLRSPHWLDALCHPSLPADSIRTALSHSLEPDEVFELAALGAYKVNGLTFAWKERGGFTWGGMMINDPQTAQHLAAYLDRYRGAVAAASQQLGSPVAEGVGGRGKGLAAFAAGAMLLAVAIVVGHEVHVMAGAPISVVGLAVLGNGGWRLAFGELRDGRTRRPLGWWESGLTMVTLVGAFLGVPLPWLVSRLLG